MNKIKNGFTLAEVLITLAVIGVIAAISIPSLISSTNKQEYVVSLKKEYAVLSQVYLQLQSENGGDISGAFATVDDVAAKSLFVSKLNVTKNCGEASSGCWYNTPLYLLDGTAWSNDPDNDFPNWASGSFPYPQGGYLAVLADGALLYLNDWTPDCSQAWGDQTDSCLSMLIDVNGKKGPNTVGRDVFGFSVTKHGLRPSGTDSDGNVCVGGNGIGCAAKVLTEGAMNY